MPCLSCCWKKTGEEKEEKEENSSGDKKLHHVTCQLGLFEFFKRVASIDLLGAGLLRNLLECGLFYCICKEPLLFILRFLLYSTL